MPDPPVYFAVAEIATQQIIYCGSNFDKAAELLTVGTCYATGYNGIEAERKCRAMAGVFQKNVVESARKLDET